MLVLLGLLSSMVAAGCEYNTLVDEPASSRVIEQPEPFYVELEPRLSSIQDNLFSPGCGNFTCHDNDFPSEYLKLDEGKSYNYLVNVPSYQNPAVPLVYPGKPDSSYLIWKLERSPGIKGSRMPIWPTRQQLDQRVIDVIRQWIEEGAQDN